MRILYLEDEPMDAELVQATLDAEGIDFDLTVTDTKDGFLTYLHQGGFDLILADYTLPLFDGISALKIAKDVVPEIPFIFVSGTLGDERGVEALKLGATDYIFKERLSKIAPSVRRALREADDKAQRKIAEEALRRSEAYLARAQELSLTGSFGWQVSTGRIYWSDETYRIFEVEPGIEPTLDLAMTRVHPEDRELVQQVTEAASKHRKDFDFEHRLLMPDGSVKYVRVVGHASAPTNFDVMEFVGAVTDITRPKQAEEELQQLVDFVPQIILVLEPDGKWIYANRVAREYLGLTLDEFRSQDVISRTIHPDDVKRMRALRERGLSRNAQFEIETRLLGKDGVGRWFLLRYNPLVEHGRVRRWYASATEIESRKKEEERVRKENVRLEERTRIAQELHDTLLQTFMSASMQLGAAMDGVTCDPSFKASLDRVLQLMEKGIEEARNTLQDLRSSDSCMPDLVRELAAVQQELAIQADIDFRVNVTGHRQPLSPAIRHEIYRIGREALVNAFNHSQANCVEFELDYGDSYLRMRVTDNGCGIESSVLKSGRKGHWGLTGMRERAASIGGLLEITSKQNDGTEIEFSIPGNIAFELSPAES